MQIPFFREIEQAQNILISGAGGGFDIFSGLPLYFALRAAGKQVHLANLSFSNLEAATGRQFAAAAVEVTADSQVASGYFPEFYLSRWFRSQREEVPIYCFDRTGFKPLLEAYRAVADHVHADTVVLVDGGTDSLMRGDEAGFPRRTWRASPSWTSWMLRGSTWCAWASAWTLFMVFVTLTPWRPSRS